MQAADNKKALTVGLFIFIGIVIFLVGVFTLGGQKKAFIKSVTLNVVFDDIQGLKVGNNVWFSGVKIGTVKELKFYGTSQVQVFLDVEKSVQQYIHKDAKASISSDGFIGNKIVVLEGGTPSLPVIEDGDKVANKHALSTDDLMKTLQVNNKNLVDITNDFKVLSKNLVEGKGMVGALLTDEEISNNFRTIVKNLNTTMASANQMAVQLHGFSNKLNTKGGLADKMLTDTVVFAQLQASVSQLQKTAESASELTANLNTASSKLNSSDNAMGLLLNDEQSAEQLKSIINNLESGSRKLDENLEALQHNFLLRGYFKKKAKEENK